METNKVIIALFGITDTGKTTTLNGLINYLRSGYEVRFLDEESKEDNIAIFKIKGIYVGIATGGDDGEGVNKNIHSLINEHCSIIVTATRTKGDTTNIVSELAKVDSYSINWLEKSKRYKHDQIHINNELAEYQDNKYNATDMNILLTTIFYYINNRIS